MEKKKKTKRQQTALPLHLAHPTKKTRMEGTITITSTPAAEVVSTDTVGTNATEPAKRCKPAARVTKGVKRGVKRPLRRVTDDVLRTRRAEFMRRKEAHVAAAANAGKLVQKYDAEFMHRGIAVDVSAA
jgi:hypothetical protein